MQQNARIRRNGLRSPVHGFVAGLWIAGALGLVPGSSHASELAVVPAGSLPRSADNRLQALIGSHKGRPVVINFWASWCEPCREEMPSLQRLANRWRDKGLAVITIAVADNPKKVEDFLWEISVELPVIDDREQIISRSWGARALPTTVILDRRHRIRLRGLGPIDWDSPSVDQKLQPLLK